MDTTTTHVTCDTYNYIYEKKLQNNNKKRKHMPNNITEINQVSFPWTLNVCTKRVTNLHKMVQVW